ncbi:MAG: DUF362 domain-containing protein [Bryobacterales bacterium]|nr:DUF362 domain-containing protein [Bryobacterales bacterium]
MNRRQFVAGMGAAAALTLARPAQLRAAPTAPVAVARCKDYGPGYLAAMEKMFDQLGGIGRIVKGKTVTVKINLTGQAYYRLGFLSAGRAHWNHPQTIAATVHLLEKAGAKRIRVVEGAFAWPDSLEEFMYTAGWDPKLILGAARNVELINTNLPYPGKKPYTRYPVPNGGHLFPAYDLSTAYDESDVLVSMNKIKEHATAGITLSIKNCFGITPTTIYGDRIGTEEPSPVPYGGRGTIMHSGARQPPKGTPSEKDPKSPRDAGYRIPRCIADLVAAYPVHLAILEAVETMAGGEGPWIRGVRPCSPGVLVAGTNCVTTDAVATAVMGFDPMADRGKAPFETCDNTLRLAEELGVGTRDLKQIEVIGTPIQEAMFKFRDVPRLPVPGAGRRPS